MKKALLGLLISTSVLAIEPGYKPEKLECVVVKTVCTYKKRDPEVCWQGRVMYDGQFIEGSLYTSNFNASSYCGSLIGARDAAEKSGGLVSKNINARPFSFDNAWIVTQVPSCR